MIRAYFSRVVTRLEQLNPHAATEAGLREKASRLQGISTAFKDRKGFVKTYLQRSEMRKAKFDRLQKM